MVYGKQQIFGKYPVLIDIVLKDAVERWFGKDKIGIIGCEAKVDDLADHQGQHDRHHQGDEGVEFHAGIYCACLQLAFTQINLG